MLNTLKALYEEKGNKRAWETFLKEGLPTHQHESFRHVPLAKLYRTPFERGETKVESSIPFSKESPYVQNRVYQLLSEEKSPFVLLNLALSTEEKFLYFPQNSRLEAPVQLIFEGAGISMPRVHIMVGKGSEVTFEVIHRGSGFMNSLIDVTVEENAKISVYERSFHEGTLYYSLRSIQKRDSSLLHLTHEHQTPISRRDFHAKLIGENGSVKLLGLGEVEMREVHTHILVEHVAPHCYSNQHFKSIVKDRGKASFYGTIYVHPEAQKTDAYQLSNALLLDEKAAAFSEPNLRIFADDVKATHGATIGQLDQDQMFYLRARGLDPETAKKLLVQGFASEILEEIPCLIRGK
jgi:Fe-S cluster assembly protein SufD